MSLYYKLYTLESTLIACGLDIHDVKNMPKIYNEELFKVYVNKCINILKTIRPEHDNTASYIVGDIHGSIIQLFAPLITANIIKNLSYNFDLDKFEFEINEHSSSEVVYTGDLIYRGCHAHVMAMIEALLTVCKYAKVHWCFGNHDIEFIGLKGVPSYILREYIDASPRFDEIHEEFVKFACDNPNILYYDNKLLNFTVSHTIQTYESVSNAINAFTIQKGDYLCPNLFNLNNMMKVIAKDIADGEIYNNAYYYNYIIKQLYWMRYDDIKDKDTIYANRKYQFIGHTYGYFSIVPYNNHNLIFSIDNNTLNDELHDTTSWIKIMYDEECNDIYYKLMSNVNYFSRASYPHDYTKNIVEGSHILETYIKDKLNVDSKNNEHVNLN